MKLFKSFSFPSYRVTLRYYFSYFFYSLCSLRFLRTLRFLCWFSFFCFFCLSVVSTACDAGMNSDLNHFFNGLGFAANASEPTAYEGQEAGYYTGGSLFLRNSVRNVQIAQVDLPKVNAGCGGIDLYLGGFSFINGQGIKTLMQNILHGATGYVAELALEQALPQAANVMRHLEDIANQVNQFNINSCHAATELVGSLGLQTQASQMNVCESAAIHQGRASNWTEAQQLCRDPNQYQLILNQAEQNPQYQALIVNHTNLAWKALMKNSFLASDTQLAELLMTLSGSIIVQDGSVHYLPSQVNNRNLVKALLFGGAAPIYRCDTTGSQGCLNPQLETVSIDAHAALETQVTNVLQDLVTKVEANQPLTREEIGFLQSTRLPLYKILNVQVAYRGSASILDVESDAEVIAIDILNQYLEENLQAVATVSSAMQYPPSVMHPFLQGIQQAEAAVHHQEGSAYQKIEVVNSMIERTQMMERMLAGSLSSRLYDNLKWSGGVR